MAIAGEPSLDRPHPRWDQRERAAFLAGVPLFGDLPADATRDVARLFRPRRLRRGAYAFHAGEPADAIHLLAEGRVKVVRETEDGQEAILRLIGPGELFGAAGGWGGAAYPASAVAGEDSVALRLPSRAFAALVGAHPAFALALVRELAERLREAEARVLDLQTQRVERRLARAILRLAHRVGAPSPAGVAIAIPLSRQDLAELTGMTLGTVSRTLSAWERLGLVATGRERITIRRPHDLVALADDLPTIDGIAE